MVEAPLKTKNSYRSIAVGADTIKVFKGMEQKDEYVFPSLYGGPMSPDSILHMLQRVLKRAGPERIRFHNLRHTFPVLALQNGVDMKTLSAMLGHFCRVYVGHLCPRYHFHAEAGGEHGGKFPLRYPPALTAPDSRTQRALAGSKRQNRQLPASMGHGLGQTGSAKSNHQKNAENKSKATEIP